MKSEKITAEELGKLRSRHDANNIAKDAIATIEIKLNRLQAQKENSLKNFDTSEATLEDYENHLVKTYGKGISIHLQDGTITRTSD